MHTQTLDESPRNERGGQVSYLLLAKGQFGAQNMAITWVDCAPGSQQQLHEHAGEEQVYVIVRGRGTMIVAGEEQEVGAGTMIFTSRGHAHAIRNTSDEPLTYVSATSPPFDEEALAGVFRYRSAR